MNTSELPNPFICDATPLRHFAVIDQVDLLASLVSGVIRVPRSVFDLDEDPGGVETFLSDLGRAERYWLRRSRRPDAMEKWSRLRSLRQRTDIEVVDLDEAEVELFAALQAPSYARSLGFAASLAAGEAAVIAVAAARHWDAVIDEADGTAAFHDRVQGGRVMTSRVLLRSGVSRGLLESPEAEVIYMDLLEGRYRGPQSLWSN